MATLQDRAGCKNSQGPMRSSAMRFAATKHRRRKDPRACPEFMDVNSMNKWRSWRHGVGYKLNLNPAMLLCDMSVSDLFHFSGVNFIIIQCAASYPIPRSRNGNKAPDHDPSEDCTPHCRTPNSDQGYCGSSQTASQGKWPYSLACAECPSSCPKHQSERRAAPQP